MERPVALRQRLSVLDEVVGNGTIRIFLVETIPRSGRAIALSVALTSLRVISHGAANVACGHLLGQKIVHGVLLQYLRASFQEVGNADDSQAAPQGSRGKTHEQDEGRRAGLLFHVARVRGHL